MRTIEIGEKITIKITIGIFNVFIASMFSDLFFQVFVVLIRYKML